MSGDDLVSRSHVDEGVLREGAEDEEEASGHPYVDGLDVTHPGEVAVDACVSKKITLLFLSRL